MASALRPGVVAKLRAQPFRRNSCPMWARIARQPRESPAGFIIVCAVKEQKEKIADVDRLLSELGINRATAKQILRVWRKAGATDPAALEKLFRKRGADRSVAVSIQFALDASSALVAWYSGINIATSRAFGPFTLAAEFVIYTVAMYLTINATLDVFSLVAIGLLTRKYSASSAAVLEAVESLAGPDSGLQVVDKARRAVVTVQVLSALSQILDKLKQQAGATATDQADFYRDLGAYLVLLRAYERGFDPVGMGLSQSEAADIAAEFAVVDEDDSGRLDLREFSRLCARMGRELSEEEASVAMSVLDTNNDNLIDFEEFTAWWQSKGTTES